MRRDSALVHTLSPSPNRGDRAAGRISALILHYTGMRTGAAARLRLLDPSSQVSCHYLVWEDGRIEQMVAERDRAWHAGRSCWAGERDINSASVGIEIVNGGHEGGCPPYPAVQIEAVIALTRDICTRHAIAPARVLGHSDVAPDRKRDPGEWFPWKRLADAGSAHAIDRRRSPPVVPRREIDAAALQRALRGMGYDCPETGVIDAATRFAVAAFQRRHRPARVDGVCDDETQALLTAAL